MPFYKEVPEDTNFNDFKISITSLISLISVAERPPIPHTGGSQKTLFQLFLNTQDIYWT
ncbi:hypothetical protein BLFGPEAP_00858 [Candidatus Methanoperedenaceae archaeon GB50]|nr:hypothetical protein BLFGPEAP_00858 [Candidatus Methanoperedenaceae archaeon GB50]